MSLNNSIVSVLNRYKGRDLPLLWFLVGSEPLLILEAQDAIRSAAKEAGFTDRKSFVFDGNADYTDLYDACSAMSLFGEKTIIEVTLPRATIGLKGAAAMKFLAKSTDESRMIVISLLNYDWKDKKKDWFKELEAKSIPYEAQPIERRLLPRWISNRAKELHGIELTDEASKLLADKTEGNLLACAQEIEKLALLRNPEKSSIDVEDLIDAVSDVSRYDQEALQAAVLQGDAQRVSKVLDSLRAENIQIPSFLWILTSDVEQLIRIKSGDPVRGFGPHLNDLKQAAKLHSLRVFETVLKRLSNVERLSKGLWVKESDGDPWQELKAACLLLSIERKK